MSSSPAMSQIDELAYWKRRAAELEQENAQLQASRKALQDTLTKLESVALSELAAEATNQFRDLFEQAPVAYHEVDLDGVIRRVNIAECSLLGLPSEAILGRPVWEFVSETERELSRRVVFEKLAGTRPLRPFCRKYVTAAGETLVLEVHENLIRDRTGCITGIRTTMLNATARVEAEQTLQTIHAELEQRVLDRTRDLLSATQAMEEEVRQRTQAEEDARRAGVRWQAVVESCPLGIVVMDRDGQVRSWNRTAELLSGWSQEEVLGKRPPGVPAGQESDVAALLDTCRRGDPLMGVERQRLRRDGVLVDVAYWGMPLRDANGHVESVLGLFADISERKRLERERAHYLAELERSNADLDQFASSVSHDLQEPLRTIASYTQLLTRRYADSPDARELAEYISGATSRMQEMIRSLLTYARVGKASRHMANTELVPLEEPVQWALANLSNAIQTSTAHVKLGPLPKLPVDEAQMGLLFQNLIGNALKYRGELPPVIQITAAHQGHAWTVRVADNGIGIAPAQREHVFGVFKRLHGQEIPGTGIGLAICRKIVERHGGRIWIESADSGSGTTFLFTLPATPANRSYLFE